MITMEMLSSLRDVMVALCRQSLVCFVVSRFDTSVCQRFVSRIQSDFHQQSCFVVEQQLKLYLINLKVCIQIQCFHCFFVCGSSVETTLKAKKKVCFSVFV